MFGLLRDTPALRTIEPGSAHASSVFLDVLDDKWRGPPPTPWRIARYIEYIRLVGILCGLAGNLTSCPVPALRYRLASTYCYYFARLLMYTIGLWRYPFATLAAGRPADFVIRSR